MPGSPPDGTPIGRLLVERGVASLATVEEAAQQAATAEGRICSALLEMGACDEGDLAAALSERLGIPGVDLSRTVVDLAAVDVVPRAVAEADLLLPLAIAVDRVHVAVDSPERAARAIDEMRFVTGRDATVYVAVLSSLRRAIGACYDAREKGGTSWRGALATETGPTVAERSARARAGAAPPPTAAPPEPARRSARATPPIVPPSPSGAAAQGGDEQVVHSVTTATKGARKRILVIDDEDAIRQLVDKALQHHGYEVETAVDGIDGLEKAQRGRFHLVLVDAMLPRMHGFDVVKRIRTDPTLRDVRVIMMTAVYRGWRFAHDTRRSYGTHDYIEKPFRIDDLLRRVDAALARKGAAPQPDPAAGVVERGRAAFTAGRLDEAGVAFEEAIAIDASSADAHQGLGEVLRLRGDAFGAMTELERAVELRPDLLDAIRILATLYLQKGFRAKAAEALERGIAATNDPRQRDQLRRELMRLL